VFPSYGRVSLEALALEKCLDMGEIKNIFSEGDISKDKGFEKYNVGDYEAAADRIRIEVTQENHGILSAFFLISQDARV